MFKRLLFTLLVFAFALTVPAQRITDQQVLQMAVQEKRSGASEADIATRLMQRGATMDQIQRIRQQYARQITSRGLDNTVDNAIDNARARMRTNNEPHDNAVTVQAEANDPKYLSFN
jgi:hypothetical protein